MAKLRLSVQSLDEDEVVQIAQNIHTAAIGNPHFTSPTPTQAELQTAITAANTAINAAAAAEDVLRMKNAEKRAAVQALRDLIAARRQHYESVALGDETALASTAIPLAGTPTPIGPLPAPLDFLATMGDMAGEIDLVWNRVKGAKNYVVQMSPDVAPRTFTQVAMPTKSNYSVTGLTSGDTHVFRVAANGPLGLGPWSDESVKMAP